MNASKRANELLTVKMGTTCFVGTVLLYPVHICTVLSNLKGMYPMKVILQSLLTNSRFFSNRGEILQTPGQN